MSPLLLDIQGRPSTTLGWQGTVHSDASSHRFLTISSHVLVHGSKVPLALVDHPWCNFSASCWPAEMLVLWFANRNFRGWVFLLVVCEITGRKQRGRKRIWRQTRKPLFFMVGVLGVLRVRHCDGGGGGHSSSACSCGASVRM